jgi:hypothetical protein
MRNIKNAVVLVISGAVLLGCQTTPKKTYYNSKYNSAEQQTKYTLDDARCEAYSHGSVPMPELQAVQPDDTGPKLEYGTFDADTKYGPISGSYTKNTLSTGGFGSGFAKGFSQGGNFFDRMDAKAKRKKLYRACVADLGWVEKNSTIKYRLVSKKRSDQESAVSVLASSGFSEPTFTSDSASSIFMIDRASIDKIGQKISATVAVIYAKTRSTGLLSNTFYSLNRVQIIKSPVSNNHKIMIENSKNYDINNEVIFSRNSDKFIKLDGKSVYGKFFNLEGRKENYLEF